MASEHTFKNHLDYILSFWPIESWNSIHDPVKIGHHLPDIKSAAALE
jgi:hypothetical protein